MDRESMASSLGPGKRTPAFFVWGDVFHAFHAVITDRRARPEACGDEFLAAERMRDLAAEVVPLLRGAGEPLSRLPYPGPGCSRAWSTPRRWRLSWTRSWIS